MTFLAGEINPEPIRDISRLTQELKAILKTFSRYLFSYAEVFEATDDLYQQSKRSSALCSLKYKPYLGSTPQPRQTIKQK